MKIKEDRKSKQRKEENAKLFADKRSKTLSGTIFDPIKRAKKYKRESPEVHCDLLLSAKKKVINEFLSCKINLNIVFNEKELIEPEFKEDLVTPFVKFIMKNHISIKSNKIYFTKNEKILMQFKESIFCEIFDNKNYTSLSLNRIAEE